MNAGSSVAEEVIYNLWPIDPGDLAAADQLAARPNFSRREFYRYHNGAVLCGLLSRPKMQFGSRRPWKLHGSLVHGCERTRVESIGG